MARLQVTIDSILGGFSPASLIGSKDQYQVGIGIDPDMPLTDDSTEVRTGTSIRPVNYSSFSGANVTSYPIAIITTPKTALTYVVLANGRLLSYTSALASETLIGTVSGGVANGAFYYNNYIYIMGTTNVSRYGPLDGSASLTDSVWTGATLGSLTALTNTTYPNSLLSVPYLNHFGIVHVDGSAYFLDYANGQGMVHRITTKKVTNEGDTNGTTIASAYNVLNLPFNYMPISISSFGNNLVIAASFTSSSSLVQGKCALFFWDTTSSTFYQVVSLPDTICTVLKWTNGQLYGLEGDLNSGGYKLFRYLGGESIEVLEIIESGNLPLQGASAVIGSKLVWAADTVTPITSSGLYGYGTKSGLFTKGLHNIASVTF